MSQPPEDQIVLLREFTGLRDRETLILFLKGNHNSVEQAANAFFENPDPSRYESQVRYDDSQFSADRHGATQGTQDAPFQLDDDNAESPAFGPLTAGAPSRPPSREYGPQPPPEYGTLKSTWEASPKEEYEGENEAIKRSLADQQTGTINASGQEVVPDVEANERQRILGQPVLLKHMLVQDFLPSLVTILHSVPKLRNALLNSESHLYDYGFNSQWWSGESIQTPTISYTDDTSTTENTSSACPPIVAEVQRLMAFLDKSERAYGSAEALSRVHAIKVYEQTSALPKPLMERFVETWDSIGDSQSLFLSTITDLKQSSAATRDLHMFEARTGFAAPEKDIALVDVLDNCFWDVQDNGDFEPDHFLDEVAPVQILTIRPHKTWNLLVPPEIFLDRYLLSNSDIIQQMKNKKSTYVQQIDKVNSTLKKLETYKYNSSTGTGLVSAKEGNAVRLMEDSIKFLQDRSQEAKDDEVKNQTRLTIAKLEKISARVEEKIQALKAEKEEAQTAMKKFSAILTDPSTPPQPSDYEFECRYVLRGVATASPRTLTTYASYAPPRRTSAQDASVQWWKLCYDTTGPTPRLEKSSVSQDEVLAEAGKGAQDTMLVYTSSAMLSGPPPVPLPPQLERFVEKDNAAFREELEQSDPFNVPDGPGPAVPITLTGVRTRSSSRGSDDSMTVNRDDEGIEMDERDLPPPYDGSEKELEDVKMEPQPEMEERNGHGRPGLFDMPHKGIPGSDTEMEGP